MGLRRDGLRRRWSIAIGVGVAALMLTAGAGLAGSGVVRGFHVPAGSTPGSAVPTGSGLPASASPIDLSAERLAGVSATVARLDSALRHGDPAAVGSAIDPAVPGLSSRWRGFVRGIARVGLQDVSLRVLPAAMATGRPLPGYHETVFVPVSMHYLLTPWDPAPVATVLGLTFGHRGTAWLLVDDLDGAARLALGGPYEPWLLGDVGTARRAHVLVVGDPSRTADNDRLAGALEQAVVAVRAVVGATHWNGRVVAYASTDPRFVASWFGARAATGTRSSAKEPATFAAEVRTLPGSPVVTAVDPVRPVTARIAVTPFLLSRADARAHAVLRHEITHVALALEGTGAVATWLVEGTAEYTAYRVAGGRRVNGVASLDQRGLPAQTWRQLRRGTWAPTLPAAPAAFYGGTASEVADHYTTAWLTCLYISSHYGERALFRLYAAAASAPAGQSSSTVEASALRQVLGISRSRLLQGTVAYAVELRSRFT